MANLHFTLDRSAGKLLAQVAQEHLLCNIDPKRAIETFTMSLNDLPVEMAIKLLSSEPVIEVEDDGVNVNVVFHDENKHSDYPKPNFVDWYLFQHEEIRRSGDRIRLRFEGLQRNISIHRDSFDFEFNYQALGKFIIKNDITETEDTIDSDPRVENMRRMLRLSDAYLRKTYRLFNVFDFLEHTYPQQINPFNGCVLGTHYPIINRIEMKLKVLIEYDYELVEAAIREEDEGIKKHIEPARDIEKELRDIIQPSDIKLNYSAGWLDPNGFFYGLSGEISNMLHMNLADTIREKYKAEKGTDIGENPDRWLEEHGWAKIHGNWILYSGYDESRFSRKDTPLIDCQKNSLAAYGSVCHKGTLKIGYQREAIPAARLNIVDDIVLRKYFSL